MKIDSKAKNEKQAQNNVSMLSSLKRQFIGTGNLKKNNIEKLREKKQNSQKQRHFFFAQSRSHYTDWSVPVPAS